MITIATLEAQTHDVLVQLVSDLLGSNSNDQIERIEQLVQEGEIDSEVALFLEGINRRALTVDVTNETNVLDVEISRVKEYRELIWDLFEDQSSSKYARILSTFIMVMIVYSILAMCLDSMHDLNFQDWVLMKPLEYLSMIVFSVEFAARIFCCPSKKQFVQNKMNWIDFLAIVPFYMELMVSSAESSSGALRALRLLRVFRIVKMSRYVTWLRVFAGVMKASMMPLLMVLFLIILCAVFVGTMEYFLERGDWNEETSEYIKDDVKSKYQSIISGIYWAVITMTTCGYGDVVPVTVFGKIIAVITGLAGILIIAIPISVINTNFQSFMTIHQRASESRTKQLQDIEFAAGEAAKTGTYDSYMFVSDKCKKAFVSAISQSNRALQAHIKQTEFTGRDSLKKQLNGLLKDYGMPLDCQLSRDVFTKLNQQQPFKKAWLESAFKHLDEMKAVDRKKRKGRRASIKNNATLVNRSSSNSVISSSFMSTMGSATTMDSARSSDSYDTNGLMSHEDKHSQVITIGKPLPSAAASSLNSSKVTMVHSHGALPTLREETEATSNAPTDESTNIIPLSAGPIVLDNQRRVSFGRKHMTDDLRQLRNALSDDTGSSMDCSVSSAASNGSLHLVPISECMNDDDRIRRNSILDDKDLTKLAAIPNSTG
eukprot:TRINITY_DN222302_c0_g1_i1.p1 TRINITY_DN222302_c0_g1~~TRINITY_DN222302_c0_g1_i1.p1  ORF type:complete len:657 (+),score=160.91 TRINITY_DN222302_c0_g1_i1:148-2118(+)